MASIVQSQEIRSNLVLQSWVHDTIGAGVLETISPDGGTTLRTVDLRDYFEMVFQALCYTGTMTQCTIIASANTDMSSPETIKDSGTISVTTDNWHTLECRSSEVRQIASETGKKLRYLAGQIKLLSGSQASAAMYLLTPKSKKRNITT